MLSVYELKQIQLNRQHLTDKADKYTVCRNLNGFQAQFMVNVEHSLRIRCNERIEKNNFGDGLVKSWLMRGRSTVHVFNEADLPLFIGRRLSAVNVCESDFYQFMCSQGYFITPERNQYFSQIIVENIAAGTGEREKLKEICYSYGMTDQESSHIFNQWGGTIRELAEIGVICFKVQENKEYMCCKAFIPIPQEEAQLEMVRRYFTHFAPATVRDAAYYFGWTQTFVKEIMQKLPLLQTTIDGKKYFYLEALKNDYPDIPACILLAGFDQLMLGYQKKDSIYLPQKNLRGIFNLAGIVMPPILLNGVVVGRWRKKNNKLTFELFEDISTQNKKDIELTAEETVNNIQKVEWKFL